MSPVFNKLIFLGLFFKKLIFKKLVFKKLIFKKLSEHCFADALFTFRFDIPWENLL